MYTPQQPRGFTDGTNHYFDSRLNLHVMGLCTESNYLQKPSALVVVSKAWAWGYAITTQPLRRYRSSIRWGCIPAAYCPRAYISSSWLLINSSLSAKLGCDRSVTQGSPLMTTKLFFIGLTTFSAILWFGLFVLATTGGLSVWGSTYSLQVASSG